MLAIDRLSRTPIYEQIIFQVENLIVKDVLKENSILPSVRVLSQQLSVNPNTLQKAYAELERRGLCYSIPGNGRYISKDAKTLVLKSRNEQLRSVAELTSLLAESGISMEEVLQCVRNTYNKVQIKVKEEFHDTGK